MLAVSEEPPPCRELSRVIRAPTTLVAGPWAGPALFCCTIANFQTCAPRLAFLVATTAAAMKISQGNVPVYTISGSEARPLPEWLIRKRKRSLKNDPEFANRVDLLQDFEFEEASQCVRVSEDGDWVMSTGTYKPQIHVHYTPHLSLSFARHTNTLVCASRICICTCVRNALT